MINRKTVNGKKFVSFKTKIVLCVLLALILGLLSSFLTFEIGIRVVDEFFLSEEAEAERDVELYQSFVDFVEQNDVASTDTQKFDEWINQYDDRVYLTVYREDKVFLKDFEISGDEVISPDKVTENTDNNANDDYSFLENALGEGNIYSNYDRTIYSVAFKDGVCAVTIGHEYSQVYTTIVLCVAAAIFFVVFFSITSGFNNRLRLRVKNLSEQVSQVSNGTLNKPITLDGRDEVTILSHDIETMRSTLVDKIQSENKAWKANHELITSISHDIRNPLTSLIGYSDILHNKQYSSQEECESYLNRCHEKIYRLKELTEELFRYSLVFGKPEVQVNCTNEDATILLGQLIGEPLAELKSDGVEVASTILINNIIINVDALVLKRVFDNLFSNINKYADFKRPVVASVTKNGEILNVKLINYIKEIGNPVESSKIGLKTCERLCKSLNVEFSYLEKKDKFTAELRIPIVKITEKSSEETV
ncbi:MAG: HAMP domain-containing histidine kinase [Clostridia bacterium]|nr:HAMP domain-containing histidine kinase [Clostridia bacterium]